MKNTSYIQSGKQYETGSTVGTKFRGSLNLNCCLHIFLLIVWFQKISVCNPYGHERLLKIVEG